MGASLGGIAIAIGTGLLLAVQGPINGLLGKGLASPVAAGLISTSVSAVAALAAIALFVRGVAWSAPSPWLYAGGGLIGIVIVVASLATVPKLGAATFLAATVLGQVAAGLLVDHYGALGVPEHPISIGRLVGAAVVVAGVVLLRVF